ncbi:MULTISPECIES: hypothetical protein [unclassified Bradyrhizobium]|nr:MULTISPECIES: hypothetical protein [unclassified Bradyrhizobium]
MQKASLKGIVIGSITDVVFSYVILILLAVYFTVASGSGVRPDHGAASARILMGNAWFVVWGRIFGSFGSVLGGYVAARISKHDEVLNGILSFIYSVRRQRSICLDQRNSRGPSMVLSRLFANEPGAGCSRWPFAIPSDGVAGLI